ncbi:hypothetical protein BDZ89DRAFT_1072641 [Hymenopellis radicata]|nr:hypothetical protein BDZ89DRAFT_1072641 [Hymenopellis radicata]
MKFTTTLFAAGAVIVSVYSAPVRRDVDPNLVPDFGIIAERNSFIAHLSADVAAGHAVNNPSVAISFPTDDSVQSEIARATAVLISLQNLNGAGVGCPAASTDLLKRQKALQDGTATTAPAAPISAPATTSDPATAPTDANNGTTTDTAPATGGVDPALVPDFGITANTNPSGTGDCDGTIGPDGKPILIPCACPPERTSFIEHLSADVAAGHAVNNPDVAISFPEDDSVQGEIGRITAVLISMQNLDGPGKGCPAASTTLLVSESCVRVNMLLMIS